MRATLKTYSGLVWISLLATGCTLGDKDSLLPQEGLTMLEIYDAHQKRAGLESSRDSNETATRALGDAEADWAGFSREAGREIEAVFPVLPNPSLILYVYPHLSADGFPVPGYATVFPFYERVEYAMPGDFLGDE